MLDISLHHRFSGFTLDVAFTAPPGLTVLYGASGSGKTTIVNAVAGLLRPKSGRIAVDDWVLLDTERGTRLAPHRCRIGYIFQEGRLFPHLSVLQNLKYGAWFAPKGTPKPTLGKVVELLGIGSLLHRRPGALSGGEKQRVAIGRALLSAPRLILADEPLAALDDARKAEILPYFERLRDELGLPILYVSHSVSEVARLATSVVVLEAGGVIQHGTASEVLGNPAAMPLGSRDIGAVLMAKVVAHHADGLSELDAGGARLFVLKVNQPVGSTLRLRVAAHDVILSRGQPKGLSALNILPGTVCDVYRGDEPQAIIALDTAAGRLVARITHRSAALLELAPDVAAHAIVKAVSVELYETGELNQDSL